MKFEKEKVLSCLTDEEVIDSFVGFYGFAADRLRNIFFDVTDERCTPTIKLLNYNPVTELFRCMNIEGTQFDYEFFYPVSETLQLGNTFHKERVLDGLTENARCFLNRTGYFADSIRALKEKVECSHECELRELKEYKPIPSYSPFTDSDNVSWILFYPI